MATNAKWHEQTASCPYCQQPVGVWRNGKIYLIGTEIRLRSGAVLDCWHPDCNHFFRLEPYYSPAAVSLRKASFAFPVDEALPPALDLHCTG